ncbi:Pimeloyl-ACP methyl ester carboxylesterase [Haladaptatus litoreus]|uniref:Pimeloyl-ACP methyl ester carboxylesterase n=1 Tax=Haladaptatus litoreus TaxID=553468 RepID=A0A1N6VQD6_9EURY|nr:alpha/beta hydrolase [Haladaptatus litoreus]SIQ80092.1 Pimeloyl-ACP methyl ester carboxylesterase [Haladaptatus litoreus]
MPDEQCNGATLYFEEQGEGTTIVLLPGVTTGIRFFVPQMANLSDDFQTIALDYRGHGRSEKTETGHTVPQYARDLRAFLDQRELDDVVLVGWSMGALVAWEYIDQFGTDGIRGLVVVDMSASPFQWDDFEHGNTDLDRLTETLELVQTNHLALVDGLIQQTFKKPPSEDVRRLVFDEVSRSPPPVKSAILFDYAMRDYRNVLPDIDVPTLVCAGADEKWRTVAAVEDVAGRIPNTEFELFEESGHVPTLEQPDEFNRAVGEFVDGL